MDVRPPIWDFYKNFGWMETSVGMVEVGHRGILTCGCEVIIGDFCKSSSAPKQLWVHPRHTDGTGERGANEIINYYCWIQRCKHMEDYDMYDVSADFEYQGLEEPNYMPTKYRWLPISQNASVLAAPESLL